MRAPDPDAILHHPEPLTEPPLPRLASLAATASLIILTCAASPVILPAAKPGLWQNTMTVTSINPKSPAAGRKLPRLVTVICDPSNDFHKFAPAADAQEHCPAPTITQSGAGASYAITETCKQPDGAATGMSGTLTLDSDTASHLTMRMTSPTMSNLIHIDSKWLGTCPAGVTAGETGFMNQGKFEKLSPPAPTSHPEAPSSQPP